MGDKRKCRDQLIDELREARARIAALEEAAPESGGAGEHVGQSEEMRERLAAAVETSTDSIVITDAQGVLVYANHGAARLQEVDSPQELIGRSFLELIASEGRDRMLAETAEIMEKGSISNREYQLLTKGENRVPVEISVTVLRNPHSEVTGFAVVTRDITDRKRTRTQFQGLHDLFIQLSTAESLDETLRYCVQAAIRITSLDSGGFYLVDEVTGDLLLVYSEGLSDDFLASASHYPADSPNTQLVMAGQSLCADDSDLAVLMKDVRKLEALHSIAAIPVQYQGKSIGCLNIASHCQTSIAPVDRNILETLATLVGSFLARAQEHERRKRAEDKSGILAEQLHQSQKMEAIGRLAGGVAHDFNNILCAIMGTTDLALNDLSPADPLSESFRNIAHASERASDLTRQLLAFSRKQIIAPKVVDLSDLINGIHPMLVRIIGEDVHLRSVPQRGLGGVLIDPGQIEQIVLNLVINARDAMPDGGEILIETSEIVLDEDYCDLHMNAEPGPHVMIAVSDTGTGMDLETRSKIFEPFFTTKQLGQGTGLGLATVLGIVEQSRGRIEVYSEPGEGTSFKVYFPRAARDTVPIPRPAKPRFLRGTETVLVVEDEEILRKPVVKMLAKLGYHVLSTGSGDDALHVARQHNDLVDLLFTDVVMPHMNGRELATRLVEIFPALKVLFTSGYTQNVIAHHGVLDEDVQFLPKPYSLATLSVRIREVLDRR